jgi:hypothetical protein
VAADDGAALSVRVTPVSATGTPNEGVEVASAPTTTAERAPALTVNTSGRAYAPGYNLTTYGGRFSYVVPAQAGVTGPTATTASNYGATPLTVTATNLTRGGTQVLKLWGARRETCGDVLMNSIVPCSDRFTRLNLFNDAAGNADLPGGTYTATFNVQMAGAETPFTIPVTVNITVGERPPVADNVAITGDAETGQTLTGSFDYSDADGDVAGTHVYRWYRADDAAGTTNRTPISGATAATYAVVAADVGKYLVFEVTPKSVTGTPDIGSAASAVTATSVVAKLVATADNTAQLLTVGQANYTFTPLTDVAGGIPPYTYGASDALPAGLTLDAATGEV